MDIQAEVKAYVPGSMKTGVKTTEYRMNGARTPTQEDKRCWAPYSVADTTLNSLSWLIFLTVWKLKSSVTCHVAARGLKPEQ